MHRGAQVGLASAKRWMARTGLALSGLVVGALSLFNLSRSHAILTRPPSRPWAVLADDALAAEGIRVGPMGATVTLVVFYDYECSACMALSTRLARLQADDTALAVVWRHYPLPYHANAEAAAVAAECAAGLGRFEVAHARLFEQPSLATSVAAFARAAQVEDSAALHVCLRSAKPRERLRADMTAAGRLGVGATPTVVIGRKVYRGEPRRLTALIDESRMSADNPKP